MTLWIAVPLVLLLLVIVLILSSSLHFHFRLCRVGKDDRVELDVTALFGLIKYHYELPKVIYAGIERGVRVKLEKSGLAPVRSDDEQVGDIDKETVDNWLDSIKKMLKATRYFKKWFKKTAAHVRITKLDWSTDFSLEDAALTATAVGALWGLKWSLAGLLSKWVRLQKSPRLFVKPVFEDNFSFTSELVCTGNVSIAYMIYAGIGLLRRISKETGGLRRWKALLSKSRGIKGHHSS
ncbi:DUF2953 domain-containing protein [Paenibacillus sp. GCM10012306]|uniref:DUF2953 domain-containing protein n=1 Tax=Paenibacillus sp. GCM10012306 TaxID=3317342 RepID=UPI0036083940